MSVERKSCKTLIATDGEVKHVCGLESRPGLAYPSMHAGEPGHYWRGTRRTSVGPTSARSGLARDRGVGPFGVQREECGAFYRCRALLGRRSPQRYGGGCNSVDGARRCG